MAINVRFTDYKNYIYGSLKQEDVYAYYLDTDVTDILECIDNANKKIHNTLRDDHRPSLSFFFKGINLCAKDWADSNYTGDLFHFVGRALDINCNDKVGFIKICDHIKSSLIDGTGNTYKVDALTTPKVKYTSKAYTIIKIELRNWTIEDTKLWTLLDNDFTFLTKEKVYPIQTAWVNSDEPTYNYVSYNPCYAYHLGRDKDIDIIKLYFPFTNAAKYSKFVTNNKLPIEYLYNIFDDSQYLLLHKSRKDALLTKYLMKDIEPSINHNSLLHENIRLNRPIADKLSNYYDKVFIFNDFDRTGIKSSFFHSYCYGFIPIFLTNRKYTIDSFTMLDINKLITSVNTNANRKLTLKDFELFINTYNQRNMYAKDITDFKVKFGKARTVKLITNFINNHNDYK